VKRVVLSTLCGILITVTAFGCAMAEVIPKGVARVLLWPAFLFAYVLGPGPNIGTPEEPVYEGTVMDVYVLVMGLGLSVVFYASVTYLILCQDARRRGRPAGIEGRA